MSQVWGAESNNKIPIVRKDEVIVVMKKDDMRNLLPHMNLPDKTIIGKYLEA